MASILAYVMLNLYLVPGLDSSILNAIFSLIPDVQHSMKILIFASYFDPMLNRNFNKNGLV